MTHQTWTGSGTPPDPIEPGLPAGDLGRAKLIEDIADGMLEMSKTFGGADRLNREHDLYDGDLLPKLMQAVALWTGRSDSAVEQMRALHNILSGELHAAATAKVDRL